MVLLFFHFFSFGCHMEEGQNLSDFLLAMIPVKVPLIFETPSYYSRGKREAHLVILFWNIDSALLPKERCLCLLFFHVFLLCLPCSHWWLPESTDSDEAAHWYYIVFYSFFEKCFDKDEAIDVIALA